MKELIKVFSFHKKMCEVVSQSVSEEEREQASRGIGF